MNKGGSCFLKIQIGRLLLGGQSEEQVLYIFCIGMQCRGFQEVKFEAFRSLGDRAEGSLLLGVF